MHPLMTRALLAVLTACLASAASVAPAAGKARNVTCEPGLQLSESTRNIKSIELIQLENPSGRTVTRRARASRGGTVRLEPATDFAALGGFPAFQAALKAQFGLTATEMTTAPAGRSITVKLPPHSRRVARYTFFRQRVEGIVLSDAPPLANPPVVRLPAGCTLNVTAAFTTRVPTPDFGFLVSKPRKLT